MTQSASFFSLSSSIGVFFFPASPHFCDSVSGRNLICMQTRMIYLFLDLFSLIVTDFPRTVWINRCVWERRGFGGVVWMSRGSGVHTSWGAGSWMQPNNRWPVRHRGSHQVFHPNGVMFSHLLNRKQTLCLTLTVLQCQSCCITDRKVSGACSKNDCFL